MTWITIALAAGVPLELVQRVTGHQTTQVVLKHYFKPGREDVLKAIEGAMPRLFMESSAAGAKQLKAGSQPAAAGVGDGVVAYQSPATPASMIRTAIQCLEKMSARNWDDKRDGALKETLTREPPYMVVGRDVLDAVKYDCGVCY